jgi:hypothetical protein
MQDLDETRRRRFSLLHTIYVESQGDQTRFFDISEVAEKLDLDLEESRRIVQYLEGENLVQADWMIGGDAVICITHWGVVQVEKAISDPEKPTQYFPPVFNIIHAQTIIGSQIQQGTQASTQTGTFSELALQEMVIAIQQAKSEFSRAHLSDDDRAEADAEIQTLEAQAKSPRPKPEILRQAWATILRIAEAVAITTLVEIAKNQLHLLGS